jgi:hypothetical protein
MVRYLSNSGRNYSNRSEVLCSKISELFNSNQNKEVLPLQWKEYVTIPMCKKGDNNDCSNYQTIPLLSTK